MAWELRGSVLVKSAPKCDTHKIARSEGGATDMREKSSCLPTSKLHTANPTFTRSIIVKSRRRCPMGRSLRKRFSKPKPLREIKVTNSEGDDVSAASWSSDDSKGEALDKQAQRHSSQAEYRDAASPSPNQRTSRHNSSSPTSLFRYKNRLPGQQNMAAPWENAADNAAESCISGDRLRIDRSPALFERPRNTVTPENEPPKETKRVNGVEFEMVKKQTASSSVSLANDNDSLVRERRQTRSQTRRQERSESHNDFLQLPTPDHVRGLTIRKVRDIERTPSPRPNVNEEECTKDSPDELTLSQIKKDLEERRARPLPSPPSPEDTSSTRSRLPVSPGSNLVRPKLSSYRRSQQAKNGTDDEVKVEFQPTVVAPPMYNSQVPAPYLWVSSLSSSSRPCDPWGWSKKWTCCQCADLDPYGRDEPAQTIVEQKICSRLECGHERCRRGCRL